MFAITCFQTNTIPEPIPAICLGGFLATFLWKLSQISDFWEIQWCWGVKGRGKCPPSLPGGYHISWYRVNPIIGQVTTKILNLNSPVHTFDTFGNIEHFWHFRHLWRVNSSLYISYVLKRQQKILCAYFTFLGSSLLCWEQILHSYFTFYIGRFYCAEGRQRLCARKRQLPRFVCCPV